MFITRSPSTIRHVFGLNIYTDLQGNIKRSSKLRDEASVGVGVGGRVAVGVGVGVSVGVWACLERFQKWLYISFVQTC